MHDVRARGLGDVLEEALGVLGDGPTFVTVDIDVLDPAFAPGTGTPEPGGLTTGELLWAVREAGARLDVVGADLVEIIPTAVGSTDVTALAGDRIVRELLTGLALKRSG
jgi:agmatinase